MSRLRSRYARGPPRPQVRLDAAVIRYRPPPAPQDCRAGKELAYVPDKQSREGGAMSRLRSRYARGPPPPPAPPWSPRFPDPPPPPPRGIVGAGGGAPPAQRRAQ